MVAGQSTDPEGFRGRRTVSLRAIDHRAEDGAVRLRERVLGFFSHLFKKFYFYWRIVALQSCISFYCTAKWISYAYRYTSVQSLSRVWLFTTPWTAACQASLSITNCRSLLKLMSIESVMPSNHLNLCHPLSSFPRSFPVLGSFPMSWLLASVGQSIGYTYLFFFWTSSHLDHHRALNRVPRALLVVYFIHSSVVQLPSPVRLFAAHRLQQARIPSFTISQSLLKFMSTELVMPSNHLILCCPILLLPSMFPSTKVFSNKLALCINWPKYLELQLPISISPSVNIQGWIFRSVRMSVPISQFIPPPLPALMSIVFFFMSVSVFLFCK